MKGGGIEEEKREDKKEIYLPQELHAYSAEAGLLTLTNVVCEAFHWIYKIILKTIGWDFFLRTELLGKQIVL